MFGLHKINGQAKIPTLVAFIAIGLLLVILSVGKGLVTTYLSKAASEKFSVDNVVISNVSDSGWTVSWTTSTKTKGAVHFGKSTNVSDGIVVDDRDVESAEGEYTTHYATVRGADPGKYYFKLAVNGILVGNKDNSAYVVELPAVLAEKGSNKFIEGKLVDIKNTPVAGAIVRMEIPGAQIMTAISKSNGSFNLPANILRSDDLKSNFPLKDSTSEKITIVSSDLKRTLISCTGNLNNPIPTIVLGKDTTCSALLSGASSVTPVPVPTPAVAVINITEGQLLDSQLPTFRGKVGARDMVTIELRTDKVTRATVQAGSDGTWVWAPGAKLTSGSGVLVLTVTTTTGAVQTTQRTFKVPGNDILPVVTGSPSAVLVSVKVSPKSISLQFGETQKFSAVVSGSKNTDVTWSASKGSVNAQGMYIAPSIEGSDTVKAVAKADLSKSDTAIVTVKKKGSVSPIVPPTPVPVPNPVPVLPVKPEPVTPTNMPTAGVLDYTIFLIFGGVGSVLISFYLRRKISHTI